MQKMRKREGRVNRKREFIILSCCTRVCKDVDDVRNKNMLLALKMRKNLSDIFLFLKLLFIYLEISIDNELNALS